MESSSEDESFSFGPVGPRVDERYSVNPNRPSHRGLIMNSPPWPSLDPIPITATAGLVLTMPGFDLVRRIRLARTIYAYSINRHLYSVSTLDRIDFSDNDVNWVNLWPPQVTLYSHPIIVVTTNGWGLYQTRGGILDEIVPVEHSSPLTWIQPMTIPHTDELIRPYLESELVA